MHNPEQAHVKLTVHLQQLLIKEYNVAPLDASKFAKYLAYIILCIIGGSAGFPVLKSAQMFAAGKIILEYLYTYGFITSIGALNVWGVFDFMKYLDLKSALNPEGSIFKKRIQAIVAVTLAGFTATANFPLNYYYNKSILLSAQGFVCDTTLISCTYQRVIANNPLRDFFANKHQKKAIKIMRLLIQHIDIGLKHLPKLGRLEKIQFLENVKYIAADEVHKNLTLFDAKCGVRLICSLVELSNENMIINQRNAFWFNGLPSIILQFIICPLLPILWAYINFNGTFQSIYDIVHNKIVPWIFTPPPVIPAYLLEFFLTSAALFTIYRIIISLCIGTFQPGLPWVTNPYKHSLLVIWGLFTASFAFSSRAQYAKDFIPAPYNNYFVPIMIAITIIYKSSAFQSLISDLSHFLISKYSDEENKELCKIYSAVEKFELCNDIATNEQKTQFIEEICDPLLESVTEGSKLYTALQKFKKSSDAIKAEYADPSNLNEKISTNPHTLFNSTSKKSSDLNKYQQDQTVQKLSDEGDEQDNDDKIADPLLKMERNRNTVFN